MSKSARQSVCQMFHRTGLTCACRSHSPLIQHNRSYNPIAAALAGFSMNLCAVSMLPSIEHTSVERTEIDPSRILSSPCTEWDRFRSSKIGSWFIQRRGWILHQRVAQSLQPMKDESGQDEMTQTNDNQIQKQTSRTFQHIVIKHDLNTTQWHLSLVWSSTQENERRTLRQYTSTISLYTKLQ